MFSKTLAKSNDRQVSAASEGAEKPAPPTRVPAVSIYNTDQAIVVIAEYAWCHSGPCRHSITMDNEVLTLRGAVAPDTHNGFRQLHQANTRLPISERSFTLPSDIDLEQVDASVKQGW